MKRVRISNNFAAWREMARRLVRAGIAPDAVLWDDGTQPLLALDAIAPDDLPDNGRHFSVPRDFVRLAKRVACHRSDEKWAVLYSVLWRLVVNREDGLLEVSTDDDVRALERMNREVGHDAHRMEAFVRFRRVEDDAGREHYIAWHRPDHRIVRLTAPFFEDRFGQMRWTILTPEESVSWDPQQKTLAYGPGVPRSAAPPADELESLWRTYYGSTFNPARVSVKTMEMNVPRRYWAAMPEVQDLPELLADAPRRVKQMLKHGAAAGCSPAASAAQFVPRDPASWTLPVLAEAARGCRGCDLHCEATQTVFGEGPSNAIAILIGEQPGDEEDQTGRPFVGPAGRLLDEVLAEVGIDRSQIYVTNAVKHFKFEPRGQRRIHAKPSSREIHACHPWLAAEAQLLQPKMIVCLGSTAARAVMGPGFRVTQHRGRVHRHDWTPWLIATYHPSALLRIPDSQRQLIARQEFTTDLRRVATHMAALLSSANS